MGLAGIAESTRVLGLGQDRQSVGRFTGALGQVAGGVVAVDDQPHLVAALDHVVRGLGGVTRVWRFDRMATALVACARNASR